MYLVKLMMILLDSDSVIFNNIMMSIYSGFSVVYLNKCFYNHLN